MLGEYNAALMHELRTLYRGRPFTKAVPFQVNLNTNPEIGVDLWVPKNSYFQCALVSIRATVAGQDLALCDTTPQQPFLFVMPPTTAYALFTLDPGYRSVAYSGAKVIIHDPLASGNPVKGVLFGWEVNPDGNYR